MKQSSSQNFETSFASSLLKEFEKTTLQQKQFAKLDTTRDMIANLYTDKGRLMPLIHSKDKIFESMKERMNDMCLTSTVEEKKD